MVMTNIVMSLIFAGILSMTLNHMPMFMKRIFCKIPATLQAAFIHFGYGAWLGGVTGHMLGAMLSVPMYFIIRFILQPMWADEAARTPFTLNPFSRPKIEAV